MDLQCVFDPLEDQSDDLLQGNRTLLNSDPALLR